MTHRGPVLDWMVYSLGLPWFRFEFDRSSTWTRAATTRLWCRAFHTTSASTRG